MLFAFPFTLMLLRKALRSPFTPNHRQIIRQMLFLNLGTTTSLEEQNSEFKLSIPRFKIDLVAVSLRNSYIEIVLKLYRTRGYCMISTNFIVIQACWQHRLLWLSFAIRSGQPSLLISPPDSIQCQHTIDEHKFLKWFFLCKLANTDVSMYYQYFFRSAQHLLFVLCASLARWVPFSPRGFSDSGWENSTRYNDRLYRFHCVVSTLKSEE